MVCKVPGDPSSAPTLTSAPPLCPALFCSRRSGLVLLCSRPLLISAPGPLPLLFLLKEPSSSDTSMSFLTFPRELLKCYLVGLHACPVLRQWPPPPRRCLFSCLCFSPGFSTTDKCICLLVFSSCLPSRTQLLEGRGFCLPCWPVSVPRAEPAARPQWTAVGQTSQRPNQGTPGCGRPVGAAPAEGRQALTAQHPGHGLLVEEQERCRTVAFLSDAVAPGGLNLDLLDAQGTRLRCGVLCKTEGAPRPVSVNSRVLRCLGSGSLRTLNRYSGPQGALFVSVIPVIVTILEMKTEKFKTH